MRIEGGREYSHSSEEKWSCIDAMHEKSEGVAVQAKTERKIRKRLLCSGAHEHGLFCNLFSHFCRRGVDQVPAVHALQVRAAAATASCGSRSLSAVSATWRGHSINLRIGCECPGRETPMDCCCCFGRLHVRLYELRHSLFPLHSFLLLARFADSPIFLRFFSNGDQITRLPLRLSSLLV